MKIPFVLTTLRRVEESRKNNSHSHNTVLRMNIFCVKYAGYIDSKAFKNYFRSC